MPSESPPPPPVRRPALLLVLRAIVAKAHSDSLGLQAAALAFTTILSLVPLLAAFSVFGVQSFAAREQQLVDVLVPLLPWSEAAIVEQMREFVEQARALRGVGVAAFLVTCLAMFTTIEQTLNQVWNVAGRRPLRNRLLSFTLVIFWGPLVIGATYGALFRLQSHSVWQFVTDSLPFQLLPTAGTVVGLTMLYWLVPYTRVDFRSALAGGVFSGGLFALLRLGFRVYVDRVPTLSLIYGGFGLAMLFMISIHIAWWIALLGSVVAWAVQNEEHLDRPRRATAGLDGPWIGLLAAVQITRNFLDGRPITPHDRLAERLGVRTVDLQQVLAPLVEAGLLQATGGDDEGVLLAGDPHEITAARILACYGDAERELEKGLSPGIAVRVGELREKIEERRAKSARATLHALAAPRNASH